MLKLTQKWIRKSDPHGSTYCGVYLMLYMENSSPAHAQAVSNLTVNNARNLSPVSRVCMLRLLILADFGRPSLTAASTVPHYVQWHTTQHSAQTETVGQSIVQCKLKEFITKSDPLCINDSGCNFPWQPQTPCSWCCTKPWDKNIIRFNTLYGLPNPIMKSWIKVWKRIGT